jgi:hypothetical protein
VDSPQRLLNVTELWNGTSWTEVNDLNGAKRQLAGAGTSTSALAFGGETPTEANTAETETWNGTNWTEVNDMNNARRDISGCGADNTSALSFGGEPFSALVESWNGTNWTNENNLNTGVQGPGGAGIQTAALAFGGDTPGLVSTTQEWIGDGIITETVT